MIERLIYKRLKAALGRQAAVGLLGPRQIGKTTLAQMLKEERDVIYLDLESPQDVAKLSDPLEYLSRLQGKLVVLDEIQRKPEIFQVLRVLIDRNRQAGYRNGQFLILGSASNELLQQSSESLAGRITYLELSGLNVVEAEADSAMGMNALWLRGGFPDSYLASEEEVSRQWREDFIRTYLERDIPQLGPRIPAETLRRLWTMLAHNQGGLLNTSVLARSLGTSAPTISRYIDLLSDLFMIRRLHPWYTNSKKRLVKAPKIYVRDSGLLHQLLNIRDYEELLSHPVVGTSWEGFVIENILSILPRTCSAYFYRTAAGAEMDMVIEISSSERWAIEIKKTGAPKLQKGFFSALEDLSPQHAYIIHAGTEVFPLSEGVEAVPLRQFMEIFLEKLNS